MAPDAPPTPQQPARTANRWLGAVMTLVGVFLLVSLNNELEVIVLVSGPVLMLAGLGAILVMFVKEMPASATWLGAAAVGLGALLFIHDLMLPPPFNIVAHVGSGLGVLGLGILQLLGFSDLASRFRRRAKAAP